MNDGLREAIESGMKVDSYAWSRDQVERVENAVREFLASPSSRAGDEMAVETPAPSEAWQTKLEAENRLRGTPVRAEPSDAAFRDGVNALGRHWSHQCDRTFVNRFEYEECAHSREEVARDVLDAVHFLPPSVEPSDLEIEAAARCYADVRCGMGSWDDGMNIEGKRQARRYAREMLLAARAVISNQSAIGVPGD